MSFNLLVAISVAYTFLLFFVAYYADRAAKRKDQAFWLNSPLIYTLSLSVYCTAWTFYGAVGSAARSGLEFLAIYIGPSLLFFGYWMILRRIVRIGHNENITSIADFLSSRFGKSNSIAVIVTLLCVIAVTPYISLQLQSISQSFSAFFPEVNLPSRFLGIPFFSTVILSLFAILFGTRQRRVNERHNGVVVAIALESLVKLFAIMFVGIILVYEFGGLDAVFSTGEAQELLSKPLFSTRWVAHISLAFMAVLVLPRMFHVIVVENENERDLMTASWAFPLYMLLLNLLVFPIAVIGLNWLGPDANPDYYLISIPIYLERYGLAYLSVIGGLSAATSMIVVTAIAVATMISNHIFMPIWLDARGNIQHSDDVSRALLRVRRVAIILIMIMSYGYFEIAGTSRSLASIGLIAFVGVAQLFPALIAAVFWRGANRNGAILGIVIGGFIWFYLLFLPSFVDQEFQSVAREGIFGVSWLSPGAFFGVNIDDPLIAAMFWSLAFNAAALFFGSILSTPKPMERLQANHFVDVFSPTQQTAPSRREGPAQIEDYIVLANRVLGTHDTTQLMNDIASDQGIKGDFPIVNDFFLDRLERALGGVLGGAAAHALVSQIAGTASVSVSETIKLADETVQNIEYARALEAQSRELEITAQKLREANATLVELDAQKDAFLSQVSHELRTPMAAVNSFTDILLEDEDLSLEERRKMLNIISEENHRLTDLLNELLDLSYLESGQAQLNLVAEDIRLVVEKSIRATEPVWAQANLKISTDWKDQPYLTACDFNRLSQVFINLISNAAKYVGGEHPELVIKISSQRKYWNVDFIDNGPGVRAEDRETIFEKFSRGGATDRAGSTGLGLAISREIAENLNGKLELRPSLEGSCFRVSLLKI